MLVCPGTVLRDFYQTWQAAPGEDPGLWGVLSLRIMNLIWDDSAGTEVGYRREVNFTAGVVHATQILQVIFLYNCDRAADQ